MFSRGTTLFHASHALTDTIMSDPCNGGLPSWPTYQLWYV